MTYYTTKCPHCGKIIKFYSRQKYSSGCPFKECTRCGKVYVDPNCYEPALKPYKQPTKLTYVFAAILLSLVFSSLPILLLLSFSTLSAKNNTILCGVVFLVIFSITFYSLLSKSKKTEQELFAEWTLSDSRLRNPQYAMELKNAGFKVPEKYLVGVNSNNNISKKLDDKKFICKSCGAYSSGWYQDCPSCKAKGTMEKVKKETPSAPPPRPQHVVAQPRNTTNTSRDEKRFVCRSCGKISTGWYQSCPNCGAIGKMDTINVIIEKDGTVKYPPNVAGVSQKEATKETNHVNTTKNSITEISANTSISNSNSTPTIDTSLV